MKTLRVTKIFNFEAAHILPYHEGLCKNIHGHSYSLEVTLLGEPKQNPNNGDDGMLIDFSELKKIVNKLDHCMMAPDFIDHTAFKRKIIFNNSPTCENVLLYIKDQLSGKFPKDLKLVALKLHETSSSFAEWRIEDQD